MGGAGMPMVSVVCLVYNHEKYVREALDGFVMQQTDFPFEVIIHDDASTDKSAEIIKEYELRYPEIIKPIYQTENQYSKEYGRVTKIVYGAAKGKYIALCEGDDYWIDPLKLQKQVEFLEENKEYGLVFTDADLLYQETGKLIKNYDKTFKRKVPTGNVLKQLINGNPYKTCTALGRADLIKEYIDKMLPLQRYFRVGDYPLWLFIASKSKVGYLPKSTTVYRVLRESTSNFKSLLERIAFEKNNYKLKRYTSQLYSVDFDKEKHKNIFHKNIIKYCIEQNRYKELPWFSKKAFLVIKILLKEKIMRPMYKFLFAK